MIGRIQKAWVYRKLWVENIHLYFPPENVDRMRNIPINRQRRCFCLSYLCNSACSYDILKHYRLHNCDYAAVSNVINGWFSCIWKPLFFCPIMNIRKVTNVPAVLDPWFASSGRWDEVFELEGLKGRINMVRKSSPESRMRCGLVAELELGPWDPGMCC